MNVEEYLSKENRVWYRSVDLIAMFGKDELNRLYRERKIEVRNGVNQKVIRWIN